MKLGLVAIALLVICTLAPAVCADTITLQQGVGGYTGTSDSWIDSLNPATNNGGSLGEYMLYDSPKKSTLLKFSLVSSLPAGAVVDSATLYMHLQDTDGMGQGYQSVDIGVYRVKPNRDWAESEATWNDFRSGQGWTSAGCSDTTQDRSATADSSLNFDKHSRAGFVFWDVTSSLQAWVNSGDPNNGWLVRAHQKEGTPATVGAHFDSGHVSDSTLRPKLEIAYHLIPVPEPAALTALGAGVLGLCCLFRHRRR